MPTRAYRLNESIQCTHTHTHTHTRAHTHTHVVMSSEIVAVSDATFFSKKYAHAKLRSWFEVSMHARTLAEVSSPRREKGST